MRAHLMRTLSALLMLVLLAISVGAQAPRDERTAPTETRSNVRVGGGDPVLPFLRDGGIESSVDSGSSLTSPAWDSTQTVFSTPLCSTTICSSGAAYGPRTGSNWVLFWGTGTLQSGSMSQQVIIPNIPSVTLSFYQWIGLNDGAATLTVRVDGNLIYSLYTTDTNVGYAQVLNSLNTYADGQQHTLSFEWEQSTVGNIRWNIDDIKFYPDSSFPVLGNTGFEFSMTNWTVTNKTGDKLKCDTISKTFAYTDNCAFRFKGGPGEYSSLSQTSPYVVREALPLPAVDGRAPANQALVFGAMVKAGVGTSAKLILKVRFSSMPTLKAKKGIKPTGGWKWIQTAPLIFPYADFWDDIKLTIRNKSASGKVTIDNVSAFYSAF
jgi:hypothetical protein